MKYFPEGPPPEDKEALAWIRHNMLEGLQSQTEGLNIKRIESFMQEEGLEVKPYFLVAEEYIDTIVERVGHTGFLYNWAGPKVQGAYLEELDVVLVKRLKQNESYAGPIFTEGILIHELAHASSLWYGCIKSPQGVCTARIGFHVTNKSEMSQLEEGFADSLRARYMRRYLDPKTLNKFAKALGRRTINIGDKLMFPWKTEQLPIPLEYLIIEQNGLVRVPGPAPAGYAIELLGKQAPELRKQMIQARRSLEGLRTVAKTIENIKPGLYSKIQSAKSPGELLAITIEALK